MGGVAEKDIVLSSSEEIGRQIKKGNGLLRSY